MNRYLLIALLAFVLLPSVLPAQPDPNGGPGNQPMPPNRPPGQPVPLGPMGPMFNPRNAAVEITPNGLFLLAEGMLVRYSPDLEQCVTLQLLPPLAAMPAEGKGEEALKAQQKWFRERVLRGSPAAMLPDGDMLYIVYANILYRVNQNTLKMEKTPLDAPQPGPGGDDRMPWNMGMAPLLKLQANTLYVIRQVDLLAVDLKAGTIKRADLPKELAPAMPMPMRQPPGGGAAEAARATIVGTLGSRKDGNRTAYTLKDDAGAVYVLTGDQLDQLAGAGNLDGRLARVSGTVETRREMPAGVKGILRVQTFQLLEE